MPNYTHPDVYIEFVPGTPPIAGVGTSTAAFIGEASLDPGDMPLEPGSTTDHLPLAAVNTPVLVTNWGQFENNFGKIQDKNKTLAYSVYGFFRNGGTSCYVVRVPSMTAGNIQTALTALEAVDEVAIVAIPGTTSTASQNAVIDHCAAMKDRFAILDGENTTTITVAGIKGTTKNSEYAALYFPWLTVYDALTDANIALPPSGYIAGIYARVDGERGVHKAPANVDVRGVVGLEYAITDGEQDVLNPDGINCIRNFRGTVTVWGARTLGGDANGEYKYVNVRRLVNFIAESIEEGTRFAVFEPNAQPLWERIKRSASDFLTRVWRDGALFGVKPEQAFFVKCDESTNPPEVREAGIVITEIGIAPVKPAEFVVFRIMLDSEFGD